MRKRWGKRLLCALLALIAVTAVVLSLLIAEGRSRLAERGSHAPDLANGTGRVLQADGTLLVDGVPYAPQDNLFTMLCIGLGSSEQRQADGEVDGLGLADTIVLVCFDLDTGELTLLCIPRDTQVRLKWLEEDGSLLLQYNGHLALQYSHGGGTHAMASASTVEVVQTLLYGLQIDAWFTLDMDSVVTLADSLDGVPVVVPDDEYYCAYTGYTPGQWVLLRGEAALQFVQYRDVNVFASCEMRVERQKTFLNNLLDSLKQLVFERPWELPGVYFAMQDEYYTDLTVPEILALAFAARNVSIDRIVMQTLPGEVQKGSTYEEYYLDMPAVEQILLDVFYCPVNG